MNARKPLGQSVAVESTAAPRPYGRPDDLKIIFEVEARRVPNGGDMGDTEILFDLLKEKVTAASEKDGGLWPNIYHAVSVLKDALS